MVTGNRTFAMTCMRRGTPFLTFSCGLQLINGGSEIDLGRPPRGNRVYVEQVVCSCICWVVGLSLCCHNGNRHTRSSISVSIGGQNSQCNCTSNRKGNVFKVELASQYKKSSLAKVSISQAILSTIYASLMESSCFLPQPQSWAKLMSGT